MNAPATSRFSKALIPSLLLAVLILLSGMVLKEFSYSLVWAFIITYVCWPFYRLLRRWLKQSDAVSAAVMTGLISVFALLTTYWLAGMLQAEIKDAYKLLLNGEQVPAIQLPEPVKQIPWLGNYLEHWLERFTHDRVAIARQLVEWSQQWLGQIAKFLGNIGRNIVKFAVILVTLFFCFRDGEKMVGQIRQGLAVFLDGQQNTYLEAAGNTTRAVVYGIVLAALTQGILAALGYGVAGIKAPVLFGAVTALLALVPMGAVLVWLPLAAGLFLMGQVWQGIGLFLWGFLVVSTVDNVIRPIVISGASQVPFLVVLFGVLGGLSAFGLVGLFLGPVILSVLLAVWQAWLGHQQTPETLPETPLNDKDE